MDKVFVKLKKDVMPESGAYRRFLGNQSIEIEEGKNTVELDLQLASIAISTGDFELSDPSDALTTFDADYPGKNELEEAKIYSVREIETMTDDELKAVPGIGAKTLDAIRKQTPHRTIQTNVDPAQQKTLDANPSLEPQTPPIAGTGSTTLTTPPVKTVNTTTPGSITITK